MKRTLSEALFLLLGVTIIFISCSVNEDVKIDDVIKSFPNDPFSKNMVSSQFFDINTVEDTVIEGERGTIIVIPQGAFLDKNGNVVDKNIRIELAEPESQDEMLLSNLTSESDKGPLESQGMFYLNATSGGEQLSINSDNPIYIELPVRGSKKDLMIFKGVRGEDGRMKWVNPQPIEKYLIPVDISTLDFLPTDFENEVKEGMPYRSYEIATKDLIDSLYYSLSASNLGAPIPTPTDAHIVMLVDSASGDSTILSAEHCGIDPASIKVIKNKKYAKSLLSTREFAKRLRLIFESCDNSMLEIYIINQDKNLWELDKMAADALGTKHELYSTFLSFSMEKLTKVKKRDKTAKKLGAYYNRQLRKVKSELAVLGKRAADERKKQDKIARKTKEEYKVLLQRREKYRMDKFGFKPTEFGWYNGAVYIEQLEPFVLEITVLQGDIYDRVHTYILNPRIRSLFAMISDDNILFNRGYEDDKHLLMWKNQDANAIVIAYKGDEVFFEKQGFKVITEKPILLTFSPSLTTEKELKRKLTADSWRRNENKVKVDLEYQAFFAKERKRQARIKEEAIFISKLRKKAYPCCNLEIVEDDSVVEEEL